ncbi:HD domain-containing protein [Halobacillus salinarum]|uniref:HD domain-containing protein n=1 Tax=Halobacillus salinarum TaxID=2932257 RepID=A0ABY4EE82_9BACI|nr:HD domain-containing protein [Halobacillus salinarum]UOQ42771.1 HD domain-containing protein [Halobacillus salinarum]
MNREAVMKRMRGFVKQRFSEDYTGHDFFHMLRVAEWSKKLADAEGADPLLSETAGLLHDLGDHKLSGDPTQDFLERDHLLAEVGFSKDEIVQVSEAIATVSYSKGEIPSSLLGKVVQDADRLDAIGAIGIARTFAYGGARQQPIYNDSNGNTSLSHFHEKLLKVVTLMNTESGRKEAKHRHQFMVKYVEEFKREWSILSD